MYIEQPYNYLNIGLSGGLLNYSLDDVLKGKTCIKSAEAFVALFPKGTYEELKDAKYRGINPVLWTKDGYVFKSTTVIDSQTTEWSWTDLKMVTVQKDHKEYCIIKDMQYIQLAQSKYPNKLFVKYNSAGEPYTQTTNVSNNENNSNNTLLIGGLIGLAVAGYFIFK